MKRRILLLLLGMGLVALGLVPALGGVRAQDQSTNTFPRPCEYKASIVTPLQNQEVSGGVMVKMVHESNIHVTEAFVLLDNTVVGSATSVEGSTQNVRQFPLDVRGLSAGVHKLRIKVRFYPFNSATTGTTSEVCITNEVTFSVVHTSSTTNQDPNTTMPPTPDQSTATLDSLEVGVVPSSWQGPANINIQFEAKVSAKYSDNSNRDVSDIAAYEWEVTAGRIVPLGRRVSFSSGPVPGQGELKVLVSYGAKTASTIVPILIQKSNENAAYPEPIESGSVIADEQTLVRTRREGDSELKTCLATTLQEAYTEVVNQNKRLRSSDIEKAQQCFAARRFVIPANLAPFEADKSKILRLKQDDSVLKIAGASPLKNSQAKGIVFKGSAMPNKTILIYIFSEPLVLVAKTDDVGNWSYTLEDPLEPGSHEAFVAVEGENPSDSIRSSGFGFAIASVAKTKENPLGLSLELQQPTEPKGLYMLFSFASGALTLAALGLVVYLVKRKQKVEHQAQVV